MTDPWHGAAIYIYGGHHGSHQQKPPIDPHRPRWPGAKAAKTCPMKRTWMRLIPLIYIIYIYCIILYIYIYMCVYHIHMYYIYIYILYICIVYIYIYIVYIACVVSSFSSIIHLCHLLWHIPCLQWFRPLWRSLQELLQYLCGLDGEEPARNVENMVIYYLIQCEFAVISWWFHDLMVI